MQHLQLPVHAVLVLLKVCPHAFHELLEALEGLHSSGAVKSDIPRQYERSKLKKAYVSRIASLVA